MTVKGSEMGGGPRSDERNDQQTRLWLQATVEDFEQVDFEAPIADCVDADYHELNNRFREAAKVREKEGEEHPASRVFAMLSAITSFYFKPEDRNAPYGPIMAMGDQRSPIPEDFRGGPVAALAYAASRTRNPLLRARLADVCWLLERRRHELGRIAVRAYAEVVEGLASGVYKDRQDRGDPLLGLAARDMLQRAVQMGRPLGWESEEVVSAKALVPYIWARAIQGKNPVPVLWFCGMDFSFGISGSAIVAAAIEAYLRSDLPEPSSHMIIELWRLASKAYHDAKDEEGRFRCQTEAAEALVAEAQRHSSAMLASHWLSEAIAEYHGIPGKRERRAELRSQLIEIQGGIREEMSSYSHSTDLSDLAAELEKELEQIEDLLDLLFVFADLGRSPAPEKLESEAIGSIKAHPFSSIFGASHHDSEGKVIHKSDGANLGDGDSKDAIRSTIAEHERMRRAIHVMGLVEVARHEINRRFYLGEDTFQALFRHTPFVPTDVLMTYSRGFARFFSGDFISAVYILVPMLENSLRHTLKLHGFDTVTFDDATQTQEDKTISALFDNMRPELDKVFGAAITTDIHNVFLAKPGPSLRHVVAHGLLSDAGCHGPDAVYACWLIFRLCCIPLFSKEGAVEVPS
ncbi:hypothetical protein H4W29_003457 [Rhizobium viscosum]|uniref:DUF7380 domain-containing protein n=2 Tax=Rhizobium viscosum TaxID=1673 RepID=A0ABR9ISV2_RHIVS|nr:hypothetical protein [Rhizobium viscosum]